MTTPTNKNAVLSVVSLLPFPVQVIIHFTCLFLPGLTDAEITQAIQLAATQNKQLGLGNDIVLSGQAPPLPARHLNPSVPRTTWREYALMTAVVGGVGYALYHFVRVSLCTLYRLGYHSD